MATAEQKSLNYTGDVGESIVHSAPQSPATPLSPAFSDFRDIPGVIGVKKIKNTLLARTGSYQAHSRYLDSDFQL